MSAHGVEMTIKPMAAFVFPMSAETQTGTGASQGNAYLGT
jgi:hypothetical protein